MGKAVIEVKGRNGEEAAIPIDPERSASLLLRKCMRALPSGDDVVGFKSASNGNAVDLEAPVTQVIAECGEVLIAVYPGGDEIGGESGGYAAYSNPGAEQPPPAPPAAAAPPVEASLPPSSDFPPPAGPPAIAPPSGDGLSLLATLAAHDKPISSVSFSRHDKCMLATAGYDQKIIVWGVGAGEPDGGAARRTLEGHEEAVTALSFHPSRPGLLASCAGDASVKLWDANTGLEVAALTGGHEDWVKAVSWSPFQENALASCSDDGRIVLWDVDAKAVKKKLEGGHSDFVSCVAFSLHDPKILASSSTDKTVVVWDIATGKVVYKFTEHTDECNSIAWSPTAEGLLATACLDKLVRIYDASTEDGGGELFKTLKGHKSEVNAVAYSPGGLLASASDDSSVIVWDVESEAPLHSLTSSACFSGQLVSCVAWGALEEGVLAAGGEDAKVGVFAVAGASLWQGGGAMNGGAMIGGKSGGKSGKPKNPKAGASSRGGGGGGGGGGVAVGVAADEIGALRSDVTALRDEVKKDLKKLSKGMNQMNASIDHILALLKAQQDED